MGLMPLANCLLQPSPARQGHEKTDGAGDDVAEEQTEQYRHRLRRYNDEEDDCQDEKGKGLPPDEPRVLKGVILEIGDHEERQAVDENENGQLLVRAGPVHMIEEE